MTAGHHSTYHTSPWEHLLHTTLEGELFCHRPGGHNFTVQCCNSCCNVSHPPKLLHFSQISVILSYMHTQAYPRPIVYPPCCLMGLATSSMCSCRHTGTDVRACKQLHVQMQRCNGTHTQLPYTHAYAHLDVLPALDGLGHLLELLTQVIARLVNALLHVDGVCARCHTLHTRARHVTSTDAFMIHKSLAIMCMRTDVVHHARGGDDTQEGCCMTSHKCEQAWLSEKCIQYYNHWCHVDDAFCFLIRRVHIIHASKEGILLRNAKARHTHKLKLTNIYKQAHTCKPKWIILWASTAAVVVPSPAESLVRPATYTQAAVVQKHLKLREGQKAWNPTLDANKSPSHKQAFVLLFPFFFPSNVPSI